VLLTGLFQSRIGVGVGPVSLLFGRRRRSGWRAWNNTNWFASGSCSNLLPSTMGGASINAHPKSVMLAPYLTSCTLLESLIDTLSSRPTLMA
jgi:hypothetical protein